MNAVELGRLTPACARIVAMAREALGVVGGEVVWLSDGRLVTACGTGPGLVPLEAAREAIAARTPVWNVDRRDGVAPDPHIRFAASAPIVLPEGRVIGALCVFDALPKPYDAMRASWLSTLAHALASECGAHGAFAEERSARANVEALVDAAPVALAMTDADLRCLRHSPRWLTEMGLVGRDVIGKTLFEVFTPGAEAAYRETYERALAGETVGSDTLWLDLPDGRRTCLRYEIAPWRNPDGSVGGILVFALDLAEMHGALERSRRAERRLEIATEIADLHVFEADYAERTIVSQGAEDTFFDEPVTFERLARDPFCGVHPDDRRRVVHEFNRARALGIAHRTEYRVARSDGAEIWAASAFETEFGSGDQLVRVIGTLQNITARKRAEQELVRARDMAEAASRAKSEFLATISHEIRTPLNGVLGMAQAMAADELAPAQQERLRVLHRSGEALLALLNDVLDLAKIESGKLQLEENEFDLEQLCATAAASYEVLAASKGVELRFSASKGVKGRFVGDATRIRQIVHNLLSNAIKFTAEGSVSLAVRTAGRHVVFSVTDTGIGIPADKLDGLFEKFVQADASTTRRFGGSGLGLAIARDLVHMMGGQIEVTSEEGAGSTFRARLPIPRASTPAPRPARRPRKVAARQAPSTPLRILAAEDNEVNQLVLKTLLGQAGVEPVVVDNGAQAVEAWQGGVWDVILMDVHMPVMDGVSAARRIRELEAAGGRPRTPIIALTANAMNHQVADYVAAGMDYVVAKPLEIGALFATLDEALSQAAPGEPDADRAAG